MSLRHALDIDHAMSPAVENRARLVVDAIYSVHAALGPGLQERVYSLVLHDALLARGLSVRREEWRSITFEGRSIENAFRLDFLVDDSIIIELKAVEQLADIHVRQILTYMNLTKIRLGFIANFNVARIGTGIKRFVLTPS